MICLGWVQKRKKSPVEKKVECGRSTTWGGWGGRGGWGGWVQLGGWGGWGGWCGWVQLRKKSPPEKRVSE